MKLTLNPYTLVANTNGTLNFVLADYHHPVRVTPNEEQAQVLDDLHQGSFRDYEELCSVFGKEAVDALVRTGSLVPAAIDTESVYSRTNAFFLTHNMPQARARLQQAKVLLLGCGGIGTHMAWHMTALGVSKLTLVDFDTVERSNFNRQILFDSDDIGKIKVDVLKEKLSSINSDVQIETVCACISSEEELEAICLADRYDLVIKALDSPADFPVWLDHVAQKHQIPYIAGITMRENVLIGPSYIPGKSSYGWSQLMNLQYDGTSKVYGTAPSLGIMLYHIADELAIEAFKILTGYGELQYIDQILCKNLLTEEEHYFRKNDAKKQEPATVSANGTGKNLLLDILLMIALSAAGVAAHGFFPIAFAAAMVLPFLIYRSVQDVVRCTFLNAGVFAIGLLVMLVGTLDLSTTSALISSLVLLFGVHSAVTLFMCVASYLLYNVLHAHKSGSRKKAKAV